MYTYTVCPYDGLPDGPGPWKGWPKNQNPNCTSGLNSQQAKDSLASTPGTGEYVVYYNLVGHDPNNAEVFSINYSWNSATTKCVDKDNKPVPCTYTNGLTKANSIGQNNGVLEIVIFTGQTVDSWGNPYMGLQFNGMYPTAKFGDGQEQIQNTKPNCFTDFGGGQCKYGIEGAGIQNSDNAGGSIMFGHKLTLNKSQANQGMTWAFLVDVKYFFQEADASKPKATFVAFVENAYSRGSLLAKKDGESDPAYPYYTNAQKDPNLKSVYADLFDWSTPDGKQNAIPGKTLNVDDEQFQPKKLESILQSTSVNALRVGENL